MITVKFRRREPDGFTGYEASGHAGYAESGYDIVCAEVSALTQAVLHGLKDVLKLPVMFDIDEESAGLCAYLTSEASPADVKNAQPMLIMLHDSLRAVERDFPRYIRVVTEKRVTFEERRK